MCGSVRLNAFGPAGFQRTSLTYLDIGVVGLVKHINGLELGDNFSKMNFFEKNTIVFKLNEQFEMSSCVPPSLVADRLGSWNFFHM